MIDFHSHLDLYPNPSEVAGEVADRDIYLLSVTTTPSAWKGTVALEKPGAKIRTALGLHPQLAHQRIGELALFDKYLPETRFVGEVGLDGASEFKPYWKQQVQVFEHILNSCTREGGKILSIHSRRATREVLDFLEETPSAGIPVLHWFTGGKRDLMKAIDLNCWFSINPTMLQSKKGQELARIIPRSRILTETDGPFAKIHKHPAMPWDVQIAISWLASCWQVSEEAVNKQLLNNLRCLVS